MDKKQKIGITVRCIHHKIGRCISSMASKEFGDETTAMHGWVIGYIYDHSDKDVFQKDLEAQFSVRRSTMTTVLKLMEKNGLIEKSPVEHDARLKKLTLTPKAVEIQHRIRARFDELEKRMIQGISKDELEAFYATAKKISDNLSDEKRSGGKETT